MAFLIIIFGSAIALSITGSLTFWQITQPYQFYRAIVLLIGGYFGGILLGASGLANAYKAAARDAIENATIIEKTVDVTFHLQFEYPLMNDVMRIVKDFGLTCRNQDFNLDCRMDVSVRKSEAPRLQDAIEHLRGVTINSE